MPERIATGIGIYGGTFDPIHHGHLILAREALEKLHLEQLIFVPAALSPHKLEVPATDAKSRLEMVAAAVAGEPRFSVSDCELRREPPSYAIDTVDEIRTSFPDVPLFYLIGEDNVAALDSWNRFEELQRAVEFIVLDRTGLHAHHHFRTIHRHIDISGTAIRNRVATGYSIRYLVPPEVEQIIRRRKLYLEPQHQP